MCLQGTEGGRVRERDDTVSGWTQRVKIEYTTVTHSFIHSFNKDLPSCHLTARTCPHETYGLVGQLVDKQTN